MKKFILVILVFLYLVKCAYPLPLTTKSRWIVDESTGERVKFKCINWPAHLRPMLAEGLDKKPVGHIARHVASLGFNCVRLTYATHMFTRYYNKTVVQTFRELKLTDAIKGLQKNNPVVLDLRVVDVLSVVINVIKAHGLMVVLDNHVSEPMWCCSDNDGNGLFGDKFFEPEEWLRGLAIVGERYMNNNMVVAMSLRNELRGPRESVSEWYRWVRKGATRIHVSKPDALILISGLYYDLDFTQLKTRTLGLEPAITSKIVYETHQYSFSNGQNKWLHQAVNQMCNSMINDINTKAGFLTTGRHPAQLFVTEFGVNLMGTNRADNSFLPCYMAYLAKMDLDWALWALPGSYYFRQGIQNLDEPYGLLDSDWTRLRNPGFNDKLHLIQQTLQVPKTASSNYTLMYHPLSGRCINSNDKKEIFTEGCDSAFTGWSHVGDGSPIQVLNTKLCIMVIGDGLPVKLPNDCNGKQSAWKSIPNSFQITSKDGNGVDLCLDFDGNSNSKILSKKCICAGGSAANCRENPQSQWFQFVWKNN
uniref:glycosyl hydrolase 5 family protein-like n=1 Tax=Erigeron canadensis TaxID=72917 RepID=UPI001CB98EC3|nr:glycosyl hydrolase 5 family protein-like [Erigeron canadensis]